MAIPRIIKHFYLIIQDFCSFREIATPVCGLVRDDMRYFDGKTNQFSFHTFVRSYNLNQKNAVL